MRRARFPGEDFVEAGLADLGAGLVSEAALLVSIGAPRLQRLGFAVPRPLSDPEHRLYSLLAEQEPDAAHSRYNALIRRLVSFERALACARGLISAAALTAYFDAVEPILYRYPALDAASFRKALLDFIERAGR